MNWVTLFFIIVVITGLLLLIYGVKDKSLAFLLSGGGALIAPILYYTNLAFLMPMIPAVVIGVFYVTKKKSEHESGF